MSKANRQNGIQDGDNVSRARARPPWEIQSGQSGIPNIPRLPSCITINRNFEFVQPGTDGVGECPSCATVGFPNQIDERLSSIASIASTAVSVNWPVKKEENQVAKPKCKAIDGMDMSVPMGFPPYGLPKLYGMHLRPGETSKLGTLQDGVLQFSAPSGIQDNMNAPPRQNGLNNLKIHPVNPSGGREYVDMPKIDTSFGGGMQNGLDVDDMGMGQNRMSGGYMPTMMEGYRQNGLDNYRGTRRFGQGNIPPPYSMNGYGYRQNGLY